MYVPGLSWAVTDALDEAIVAVAVTGFPFCSIVTLCWTGEPFVKSIFTAPAFAARDFLS